MPPDPVPAQSESRSQLRKTAAQTGTCPICSNTVAPAAELVEALTHVKNLGEDLIEAHEALAMALYHAENLRRYINRVPVRDLAESEAGFQKAKRLSEIWHG